MNRSYIRKTTSSNSRTSQIGDLPPVGVAEVAETQGNPWGKSPMLVPHYGHVYTAPCPSEA